LFINDPDEFHYPAGCRVGVFNFRELKVITFCTKKNITAIDFAIISWNRLLRKDNYPAMILYSREFGIRCRVTYSLDV